MPSFTKPSFYNESKRRNPVSNGSLDDPAIHIRIAFCVAPLASHHRNARNIIERHGYLAPMRSLEQ
jgi:hypothetical protein